MKKLNKVGEVFITNEGYQVEIIEYFNVKNTTIKFEKGQILYNIKVSCLKNGRVKNPFKKSVCSVGFIGSQAKTDKNIYKLWHNMLVRCYDINYHKKYSTYKNIEVCEEWHNYTNFEKWYRENYIEGFELDKDILCPECKIYSPETCCFVPNEINQQFKQSKKGNEVGTKVYKHYGKYIAKIKINNINNHIGIFDTIDQACNAYKQEKEKLIKGLAIKYKKELKEEIYTILYNYKTT